ncbi:hypothetical protein GU926_02870 [Nibribacter ruber]|uniref:Uncharacterized protein n=1 Tax=Nibribacter ruber TaxID=2698458 RepID=A0A6P1NTR4_9BACT|nr:hypothetical protein [Nibribacter ruber]QHL86440.1 hypothetical protein GU926_02870 [Nibribacter ruber]
MDLELDEFERRLSQEIRNGANPALYIQEEIRRAESLKEGLLEELEEEINDFVPMASNKIDTYIYQLHEKAKKYPLDLFQLDQKTALQDEEVQKRIGQQLKSLKDEQNPTSPGKVNPLDLS